MTSSGATWPLTRQEVEAQMVELVRGDVEKEVKECQYAELTDSLPLRFWQSALGNRLAESGIQVTLCGTPQWTSPGDVAEDQRKHNDNVARARRELNKVALDEQREAVQFRQTQQTLAHGEAEHSSELVQKAIIKRISGKQEVVTAELELAKQQRNLAQCKEDAEAQKQAGRYWEESQSAHQKTSRQLEELNRKMQKHEQEVMYLLRQSAGSQAVTHTQVEQLISEHDFTVEDMDLLGFEDRIPLQHFRAQLRQAMVVGHRALELNMTELFSKNIGHRPVKAINWGSSLRFTFQSTRPGYTTILNIGTSGDLLLHVPNTFTSIRDARVKANSRYDIPGSHLLTLDSAGINGIRGYVQQEPRGWETLAVLVSLEPLVDEALVSRSTSDEPFVKLSSKEFEFLCTTLRKLGPDGWAVGVQSWLSTEPR